MARSKSRTSQKKTTQTKPRTRRTSSKSKSKQSSSRRQGTGSPIQASFSSISPERKLDLLGILIALAGLLTFLSLISPDKGKITGWWVNLISQIFGWGSFLIPVSLILIGGWLIFRNLENIPILSAERIIGIGLLLLNLLTFFHLIINGDLSDAANGSGGGYLGGLFKLALVRAIGTVGAAVAILAWFLIGLIFTFDISIPDLIRSLRRLVESQISRLQGSQETTHPSYPMFNEEDIYEKKQELPGDFHPIEELNPRIKKKKEKTERDQEKTKSRQKQEAVPPLDTTGEYHTDPSAGSQTQWKLPPIEAILDPATPIARQANTDLENAKTIEETLASFGVPAHVVEIHSGPTITQFGVEPDFIETRSGRTRVRVSKITSLADDLALALAARRIRIQAPVPGKSYVGIEVPNEEVSQVSLREVIESKSFQNKRSPLRFSLGKDVAGKPAAADLAAMPHLLIAGTTGSGKSVCVNAILCGFLLHNTPENLRLILVDPKRVELTGYNGIPHLLAPVVVEMERVIGALQWVLREMDSRYHKFSVNGVRNIQEYNKKFAQEPLPYLVVVIDELADLMMLAPDETERSITRLAQLARATGIHLIIATQRPSVDVVTGLIKANFPARIAFAVASGVDSRVILDQPGAERLLGRGDMLFQSPDASAPVRLQGSFVSDSEIQRLVDYWRLAKAEARQDPSQAPTQPIETYPVDAPLTQVPLFDEVASEKDRDPLYDEAVNIVRKEGKASITMLQRKLRIGYTRSARIIDSLEENDIISPPQINSQVREVLDYGDTKEDNEEQSKEEE